MSFVLIFICRKNIKKKKKLKIYSYISLYLYYYNIKTYPLLM